MTRGRVQEAGVDIAAIMREEGFLVETRRLSGDGCTRRKRTPGLGVIGRRAPPPCCHTHTRKKTKSFRLVVAYYYLCMPDSCPCTWAVPCWLYETWTQ